MEKNLTTYIKRLMELDSIAVQLKGDRDSELLELEAKIKNELKGMEGTLEKAGILAKQEHDRIIEDAKLKTKELDEAAKLKINAIQASFSAFKEDAARDIWEQLLNIER